MGKKLHAARERLLGEVTPVFAQVEEAGGTRRRAGVGLGDRTSDSQVVHDGVVGALGHRLEELVNLLEPRGVMGAGGIEGELFVDVRGLDVDGVFHAFEHGVDARGFVGAHEVHGGVGVGVGFRHKGKDAHVAEHKPEEQRRNKDQNGHAPTDGLHVCPPRQTLAHIRFIVYRCAGRWGGMHIQICGR